MPLGKPAGPNKAYRVEGLHQLGGQLKPRVIHAQSPEHAARILRQQGHLATKITEVPLMAGKAPAPPTAPRAASHLEVESPQGMRYRFPVGEADAQAAEDYLKKQGHKVVGGVNLPGRSPAGPQEPPPQPPQPPSPGRQSQPPAGNVAKPVTPFTLIRTVNEKGFPVTSVVHGSPDAAFERLSKKGLSYVSHHPLTVAQAAEAWRNMSDHLKRNKGEPKGGMKRFHVRVRTKSGPQTHLVTAPTAFSALGRMVDAGHKVLHVEPYRPRRLSRKSFATRKYAMLPREAWEPLYHGHDSSPTGLRIFADRFQDDDDPRHMVLRAAAREIEHGQHDGPFSLRSQDSFITQSQGDLPDGTAMRISYWRTPGGNISPRIEWTLKHSRGFGGGVNFHELRQFLDHYATHDPEMVQHHRRLFDIIAARENFRDYGPSQLSRRKYAARKPDAGHAFVSALRRLRSKQQQALHGVAKEIAGSLNLNPAVTRDALHDGPGGATPSIAQAVAGGDPATARYAAAWYGLLTRTPALGVFHVAPNGPDSAYKFTMRGSGEMVRQQLDRGGITPRVLLPRRDGWDVFVYDQGRRLRENVREFAKVHGLRPEESVGKGETLGHADPAEARAKFRQVIMGYENKPRQMARSGDPEKYTVVIGRIPDTPDPGRRTARLASGRRAAFRAAAKAILSPDGFGHALEWGGGVANAYRYPAESQFAVATASAPDGKIVLHHGWVGARNLNQARVGNILPEIRPLYDSRYGAAAKARALEEIKRGHHEADWGQPVHAGTTAVGRIGIHPEVMNFLRKMSQGGKYDPGTAAILADWLQEHRGMSDQVADLIRRQSSLTGLLQVLHEHSLRPGSFATSPALQRFDEPERMARRDWLVRYAANFTLSPGRPGKTLRGEDVMHHDIMTPEGEPVGVLGVSQRGNELYVHHVGFHDTPMGQAANQAGIGDMRSMRRQVLAMYPGATKFGGRRMSGTRAQLSPDQQRITRDIRRNMARGPSRKNFATDRLKGGKADNVPPSKFPPKKVAEGARVEREHTSDPALAAEIARDHLAEMGLGYYPELRKMEGKLKRRKKMSREVNPYVVLYGRKGGRKSKAWISAKIRKLITEEKKPQDQAVAIALHMAGVPKKDS